MKDDLDVALAKLEGLAGKLNEKTDAINQKIGSLNTRLSKAGIGAAVWLTQRSDPVLLDESGDSRAQHGQQLGFAKVKGAWQLAVRPVSTEVRFFEGDESQPYTHQVHGEPVPLLEAPRIVRVEACAHLPSLVKALNDRLEKYLRAIEQAQDPDASNPRGRR